MQTIYPRVNSFYRAYGAITPQASISISECYLFVTRACTQLAQDPVFENAYLSGQVHIADNLSESVEVDLYVSISACPQFTLQWETERWRIVCVTIRRKWEARGWSRIRCSIAGYPTTYTARGFSRR